MRLNLITRIVLAFKQLGCPIPSAIQKQIDRGLEEVVADLYKRIANRTPEQRQQSIMSVARKLGFKWWRDYRAAEQFVDERYKGLNPRKKG